MRCDEARSALSAWLDGECPAEEAAAVADHVRSCAACANERAALERTRALLASAGRLRAPQKWIRDAVSAAPGAPAAAAPRAARPRILSRPWAVSSLAAAAALAVLVVSVRVFRMEDAGGVAPLTAPLRAPAGDAERESRQDESAAPAEKPAPAPGKADRPQSEPQPHDRSDALRTKDDAAGPIPLREARPEPPPASTVGVPVEGGGGARALAKESAGAVHAPEGAAAGAAAAHLEEREPVLPTIAVALAQIHFAGEEPGGPLGGAAPAAPSDGGPPRILKVRVSLDPSNRILAAQPLDPAADLDAAVLVTRLPGSWLDLEPVARPAASSSEAAQGSKPAGRQETPPAPGVARAVEFRKVAAAAAPAARQVILEITLEAPLSR